MRSVSNSRHAARRRQYSTIVVPSWSGIVLAQDDGWIIALSSRRSAVSPEREHSISWDLCSGPAHLTDNIFGNWTSGTSTPSTYTRLADRPSSMTRVSPVRACPPSRACSDWVIGEPRPRWARTSKRTVVWYRERQGLARHYWTVSRWTPLQGGTRCCSDLPDSTTPPPTTEIG